MKCLKSQFQMQCKKGSSFFVNFDAHENKDKIVTHKYHSVCWIVVADACQLIYSRDKYW
jgi:hypothetical protein